MSATLEADAMTPQEITKLEKSLEEDVTTLSHKRERKAALEQQVRSTSTHMGFICFSARPLRDALLASALSPQEYPHVAQSVSRFHFVRSYFVRHSPSRSSH